MLVLPAFDAPGIMRGLTPEETNRQDNPGYWFWTGKTNGCEENKYGAVTKTSLSFPIFRRLLAKTAHGFAACQLGIDGFEPLLLDVILGKDQSKSTYTSRHLL